MDKNYSLNFVKCMKISSVNATKCETNCFQSVLLEPQTLPTFRASAPEHDGVDWDPIVLFPVGVNGGALAGWGAKSRIGVSGGFIRA